MFEDYIFTYKKKKRFYAVPEEYNVRLRADPLDLVSRYTRHRVRNSSAVENCYWELLSLLKLFIGSSVVSILIRTIKLRSWLCPLKSTNPCVHL